MGLPENLSQADLRRHYQKTMTALISAENDSKDTNAKRYANARQKLNELFERVRSATPNHAAETHSTAVKSNLLGEILIDAEMLTREQLDDVLQAQSKTQPPLPLGRILVSRRLITWEQLAYFLKLQDLLELSPKAPSRMARQLTELGLITKDELEIAELDCETTGSSLGHILVRRGWLKPSVLAVLTDSVERKPNPEIASVVTALHRMLASVN